jgi:GNAT superfamily N-acetyltransferase
MTSKEPDYGFVDDQTPEVALAVVPDHRGYGMGGALLRELQDAARAQGYSALSVEKGNLALGSASATASSSS